MLLELGPHHFDVMHRAVVIGILSMTGHGDDAATDARERLLVRAAHHVDEGADALEIGGAGPDEPVEIDQVGSAVECLGARFDVPLSCATDRASVLRAALVAGAVAGHDHTGFADPDYLPAIVGAGASVLLTDGRAVRRPPTVTSCSDVVAETGAFLSENAGRAESAGVALSRIVVDPGVDLAGSESVMAALLRASEQFAEFGYHLCLSVPGGGTDDRRHADPREVGAATVTRALMGGSRVVRTHDVRSARRTTSVVAALLEAGSSR